MRRVERESLCSLHVKTKELQVLLVLMAACVCVEKDQIKIRSPIWFFILPLVSFRSLFMHVFTLVSVSSPHLVSDASMEIETKNLQERERLGMLCSSHSRRFFHLCNNGNEHVPGHTLREFSCAGAKSLGLTERGVRSLLLLLLLLPWSLKIETHTPSLTHRNG